MKKVKILQVKYWILFIYRFKAIKNTLRFSLLFIYHIFFYLGPNMKSNTWLSDLTLDLTLDMILMI